MTDSVQLRDTKAAMARLSEKLTDERPNWELVEVEEMAVHMTNKLEGTPCHRDCPFHGRTIE